MGKITIHDRRELRAETELFELIAEAWENDDARTHDSFQRKLAMLKEILRTLCKTYNVHNVPDITIDPTLNESTGKYIPFLNRVLLKTGNVENLLHGFKHILDLLDDEDPNDEAATPWGRSLLRRARRAHNIRSQGSEPSYGYDDGFVEQDTECPTVGFCPYCMGRLKADATYCDECGTLVVDRRGNDIVN